MRLRQLRIQNFRKIHDLTIDFPRGLSVIVGENNAGKTAVMDEGNEVQVIVSSHSPILVSQAPIDSVVAIHEVDGEINAVTVANLNVPARLKKKLQRFLDATRGELFFARRLLMVEGIAEALLLPVLARIA